MVAHAQNSKILPREERVALVVGNSSYSIAPLRNPNNDADDMESVLQNLGFRVIKVKNASRAQLVESINRFGRELSNGAVGLFYYAGHGIQSNGRNFLIPTESNISAEYQIEFEAVDAGRVIRAMESAGSRVSIIILDACRDNPYARSFRGKTSGLAPMDAPKGTLIAFATRPGGVAADGKGRNGLYTQYLLQSLQHSDSDIDKVFRRVAAGVTRASGDTQIPWKSDSLTGEFYFSTGSVSSVPIPAPQAATRADDSVFVETKKDSSNASGGEEFALLKSLPATGAGSFAPPSSAQGGYAPAASVSIADKIFTPGSNFRHCDICPEMTVIPPGKFTMGSKSQERGRDKDEGPQRSVFIASMLAIGKHEVTRAEYMQFVNETGRAVGSCSVMHGGGRDHGFMQTDMHPVVCVSWYDAKGYVAWLSLKTGKKYRLPTEAEWEYAARAGTETIYYWGDSNDGICQKANGGGCLTSTLPVGSYPANAFGLHDMLGNAWEWVEDCWVDHYASAHVDGRAYILPRCDQRVMRGGSWKNDVDGLRSANRGAYVADGRLSRIGFRVVLEAGNTMPGR